MFKKILLLMVATVFTTSIMTYAATPKTALDYATISQEEWAEINAERAIEESFAKEQKKFKNRQKNKDRLSGPGALETSGNYVVNPDLTEYFETTAPAEYVGDYVEAVDPKYGITFRSKRHFKTNLGEFDLIEAAFEPVANNSYSNYQFRLKLGKVNQKLQTSYRVYIKAYNTAGAFVDYNFTFMTPDVTLVERSVTLQLFKNNERHVSRIEFGLDTSGMDPAIIAKNNISLFNLGYPDLFERMASTENPLSAEMTTQIIETYNKHFDTELKEAKKEVDYENTIHEIE